MFVKDHEVFFKINVSLKKHGFDFSGVTYENYDSYACYWKMIDYEQHGKDVISFWNLLRNTVNQEFGYPLMSKARLVCKEDDFNPYTKDAIAIEVLPEEVAKKCEAISGGDPVVAAYLNFIDAGGTLLIGDEAIRKRLKTEK